MQEYVWFLFVVWFILFILGLNMKDKFIMVTAGITGFILGFALVDDAESLINYVGYLIFFMNLGVLTVSLFKWK